MDDPPEVVDFDSIRKNAGKQGISLSEISIFYQNLDAHEITAMKIENLITHESEGSVVAKFRQDGSVMFPEKATGVHYLGAD